MNVAESEMHVMHARMHVRIWEFDFRTAATLLRQLLEVGNGTVHANPKTGEISILISVPS